MYPYDFMPNRKGINHQEIFVVMPLEQKYDYIYEELIKPATDSANVKLDFHEKKLKLYPHRATDEIRMTSGWIDVLEHLTRARIIIGVLTDYNANVFYELGIAHATQPKTRQILIANEGYERRFDTKDLIYYEYNENNFEANIKDLSDRIVDTFTQYKIEKEKIIKQARMRVGPADFAVIMQRGKDSHFPFHTIDPMWTEQFEEKFGEGAIEIHMTGITNLCQNGLLGLNTKSKINQNGVVVEYSFYWTGLGNDVLFLMKIIDEDILKKRRLNLPDFFDQ